MRTFDINSIKATETLSNREIAVRLPLILVPAVVISLQDRDVTILILALAYLGATWLYLLVVHRAPERVPVATAALIGAGAAATSALLVAAALYLWSQSGVPDTALALMLLLGMAVSSVTRRAEAAFLIWLDRAMITLSVVGMGAIYAARNGATAETTVMLICLALTMVHYFFAARHVAHARAAQQKAQNAALRQARTEAVGTLTGGVAHDFNNALAVVLGNLELHREMQASGATDAETEEVLREAEAAARRASERTAQLLSYARKTVLSPERVQIRQLLERLHPSMQDTLGPGAVLSLSVEDPLPDVVVDIAGLERALKALVSNAADAVSRAGSVLVAVRTGASSPIARPLAERFGPGNADICISVEDTGSGMSRDVLERATEPYFGTKPRGTATGMGLAAARGFAEQSGGELVLESAPGQGTRAVLVLPGAPAMPVQPSERDSDTISRMVSSGT